MESETGSPRTMYNFSCDLRVLGSSEMRVQRVNLERYLRLRLRGRQGGVNAGI